MMTLLGNFPDHVIALRADGQVSRDDYESVLIAAVENALARHDKLNVYYEIGLHFTGMDIGAMFEDLRIGVSRILHWRKIALVTDVEWMKNAVHLFGFMMPADVRVFASSEAEAAKRWIVEASAD